MCVFCLFSLFSRDTLSRISFRFYSFLLLHSRAYNFFFFKFTFYCDCCIHTYQTLWKSTKVSQTNQNRFIFTAMRQWFASDPQWRQIEKNLFSSLALSHCVCVCLVGIGIIYDASFSSCNAICMLCSWVLCVCLKYWINAIQPTMNCASRFNFKKNSKMEKVFLSSFLVRKPRYALFSFTCKALLCPIHPMINVSHSIYSKRKKKHKIRSIAVKA